MANLSLTSRTKARMILASMAPDMVRDIQQFINGSGSSLMEEVYGEQTKTSNSPGFLAMFSRAYIPDDTFEEVWIGFGTLALASIRKPHYSAEDYANILQDAFSLPSPVAKKLASAVESYDPLASDAKNANGEYVHNWLYRVAGHLVDGARNSINSIANSLGIPIFIDQSQSNDVDFLYELMLLGRVVKDLNKRASLMQSQAVISANLGLFGVGDPDDDYQDGDPELGITGDDAALGEIASIGALRKLPSNVFGGLSKIASLGGRLSQQRAKGVLSKAGIMHDSTTGQVSDAGVGKPKLKESLKSLLQGKVPPGVLKSGIFKALPAGRLFQAVSKLGKLFGGKGDPIMGSDMRGAYSDISGEYSPTIADAWLNGDIDSIVREAMSDALHGDPDDLVGDYSTGDPDLDEAIVSDVLEAMSSEGDLSDKETGGLFTRWRIRRNLRKAARRNRRKARRANRRARRARLNYELERSKAIRDAAGFDEYQEPNFDTSDISENSPGLATQGSFYYPDDSEGTSAPSGTDSSWADSFVSSPEGSDEGAGASA